MKDKILELRKGENMLTKDVKVMEENKRRKEIAKYATSLSCINGGQISDEANVLIGECVNNQRTTDEALQILLTLHTNK